MCSSDLPVCLWQLQSSTSAAVTTWTACLRSVAATAAVSTRRSKALSCRSCSASWAWGSTRTCSSNRRSANWLARSPHTHIHTHADTHTDADTYKMRGEVKRHLPTKRGLLTVSMLKHKHTPGGKLTSFQTKSLVYSQLAETCTHTVLQA